MKVLLTLWISVVLIQQVVPIALIRLPRHVTNTSSVVHTEYEAKYNQKGLHGNESLSTLSGKQQFVHDNCAENWNSFADKCASLIKELVASLANVVSSNPGDSTNLQLQIKNTFRHFDNTHNCTCLNHTGKGLSAIDLSPLFNNITITTLSPTTKGSEHDSGNCGEEGNSHSGNHGTHVKPVTVIVTPGSPSEDHHNNGLKAEKIVDPGSHHGLIDDENGMHTSNSDASNHDPSHNSHREVKYPQVLIQPGNTLHDPTVVYISPTTTVGNSTHIPGNGDLKANNSNLFTITLQQTTNKQENTSSTSETDQWPIKTAKTVPVVIAVEPPTVSAVAPDITVTDRPTIISVNDTPNSNPAIGVSKKSHSEPSFEVLKKPESDSRSSKRARVVPVELLENVKFYLPSTDIPVTNSNSNLPESTIPQIITSDPSTNPSSIVVAESPETLTENEHPAEKVIVVTPENDGSHSHQPLTTPIPIFYASNEPVTPGVEDHKTGEHPHSTESNHAGPVIVVESSATHPSDDGSTGNTAAVQPVVVVINDNEHSGKAGPVSVVINPVPHTDGHSENIETPAVVKPMAIDSKDDEHQHDGHHEHEKCDKCEAHKEHHGHHEHDGHHEHEKCDKCEKHKEHHEHHDHGKCDKCEKHKEHHEHHEHGKCDKCEKHKKHRGHHEHGKCDKCEKHKKHHEHHEHGKCDKCEKHKEHHGHHEHGKCDKCEKHKEHHGHHEHGKCDKCEKHKEHHEHHDHHGHHEHDGHHDHEKCDKCDIHKDHGHHEHEGHADPVIVENHTTVVPHTDGHTLTPAAIQPVVVVINENEPSGNASPLSIVVQPAAAPTAEEHLGHIKTPAVVEHAVAISSNNEHDGHHDHGKCDKCETHKEHHGHHEHHDHEKCDKCEAHKEHHEHHEHHDHEKCDKCEAHKEHHGHHEHGKCDKCEKHEEHHEHHDHHGHHEHDGHHDHEKCDKCEIHKEHHGHHEHEGHADPVIVENHTTKVPHTDGYVENTLTPSTVQPVVVVINENEHSGNAAPVSVVVKPAASPTAEGHLEHTETPAVVEPTVVVPEVNIQSDQAGHSHAVVINPTTFQTTSVDPTTQHPLHILSTTKPHTHADQEDEEDDCCSCESCTEEEITNPYRYKDTACKNLEEARRELKKIFDKMTKKLQCGRTRRQHTATSTIIPTSV